MNRLKKKQILYNQVHDIYMHQQEDYEQTSISSHNYTRKNNIKIRSQNGSDYARLENYLYTNRRE
jgi:hypothetical protein